MQNAAHTGTHQGGAQLQGQRCDLARGLLGAAGCVVAAHPLQRANGLVDKIDLPVGCRAKPTQVPRLEAELPELDTDAGNREGVGVVVTRRAWLDQAVLLERGELPLGGPRRLDQLGSGERDIGTVADELIGSRALDRPDLARDPWPAQRRGRSQPPVDGVEVLANHLQRKVVVALRPEHVAKSLDVVMGEPSVTRRCSLWLHQPLGLEEADLRDGHVRKVLAQR